MKKAIVFLNGDLSDLKNAKKYIKPADLIICADAGVKHCLKLNLIPNVIIGDFDSLSKHLRKKLARHQIRYIQHSIDKNEADSELALDFAVKQNCNELLIFGLLGTRLDHVLSNIFHLEIIARKKINIKIIEGNQEIYIAHIKTRIKGRIGDLVSLIPLNGDVKNIATAGLKYKLDNEDLFFGYSRGLSNVLIKHVATISIKEGNLLIIHEKS